MIIMCFHHVDAEWYIGSKHNKPNASCLLSSWVWETVDKQSGLASQKVVQDKKAFANLLLYRTL